jgi:hypothetical protein
MSRRGPARWDGQCTRSRVDENPHGSPALQGRDRDHRWGGGEDERVGHRRLLLRGFTGFSRYRCQRQGNLAIPDRGGCRRRFSDRSQPLTSDLSARSRAHADEMPAASKRQVIRALYLSMRT